MWCCCHSWRGRGAFLRPPSRVGGRTGVTQGELDLGDDEGEVADIAAQRSLGPGSRNEGHGGRRETCVRCHGELDRFVAFGRAGWRSTAPRRLNIPTGAPDRDNSVGTRWSVCRGCRPLGVRSSSCSVTNTTAAASVQFTIVFCLTFPISCPYPFPSSVSGRPTCHPPSEKAVASWGRSWRGGPRQPFCPGGGRWRRSE